MVAAHGTASAEGQRVVEACAAAAATALGVEHRVGYVDVCGPTLQEALVGLEEPVVVPFFLATGYHVRHDVPAAVATVEGAATTRALGVEEEVLTALADRVLAASAGLGGRGQHPRPDAVVVTAAGSSVRSARAEVAEMADRLGERLGVATGAAYLTGPGPRPDEEVRRLRAAGHGRVVLAAHLLSPGFFLDRAHAVADQLGLPATGPLGTHPVLVDLVVRRYREHDASAAAAAQVFRGTPARAGNVTA